MQKIHIQVRNEFFLVAIISLALAAVLSIIHTNIFIPIILLVFIGLVYLSSTNVLLSIIIISYLTTLKEIVGDVRTIYNLVFTAVLFLLFLREYGLDFKKYPRIPKLIIYFLIFLYLTLILSTSFSSYSSMGFLSLVNTSLFFIIVYMFYALLSKENNIYLIIYSLFISVALIDVIMIVDMYNLGLDNYFNRVMLSNNFEIFGSTNYTTFTFLFFSTSLLSSLFLIKKFKGKKYFFLYLLLIINAFALIFSNSRALMAASLISISFMLITINKKFYLKLLLVCTTITLLILLLFPVTVEIIELYIRLDSISQRDLLWQSGLDVISDYPVLGVGPNAFRYYFYTYAPSYLFDYLDLNIWKYGVPHPHNMFLYFWAENGLPGLITVLFFFGMFFYFGFKSIRLTKYGNYEFYVLSINITGIGLGMFFRSFVEVTGILSYGYITLDIAFWLVFIMLIFIYQKSITSISNNL